MRDFKQEDNGYLIFSDNALKSRSQKPMIIKSLKLSLKLQDYNFNLDKYELPSSYVLNLNWCK